MINSTPWIEAIDRIDPLVHYGKVSDIVGLVVEAIGPSDVALGELCYLGDPGQNSVRAEVVGFRGRKEAWSTQPKNHVQFNSPLTLPF